jgi:hypothetical protein
VSDRRGGEERGGEERRRGEERRGKGWRIEWRRRSLD